MTISAYNLLASGNIDDLIDKVTAAIDDGWQPVGDVQTLPDGRVAQQMVTEEVQDGVTAATGAVIGDEALYGSSYLTKISLVDFTIGNSADNASLGLGKKIFTFPAGRILVKSSVLNVGVTLADAIQTDTPELGLGTVVASGAVAVLGGTATFENIHEGTAMADVAGTALVSARFPTGGIPFHIAAAGVHDVFLNIADGWANLSAASALVAQGDVIVEWLKLP
jgi:hypothetical protein